MIEKIWKPVLMYGSLLALGTLALQWLDYRHLARAHSGDIYAALIGAAFLILGVVIGIRVIGPRATAAFDGNPQAQESLGITPRELTVLQKLAAGHSNKEIAACLNVAPDTVKTQVNP